MKYMNHAEVGEIICNRDFVVKNNVIIVDRSNEEDMSDMPKGIYRTRTSNRPE